MGLDLVSSTNDATLADARPFFPTPASRLVLRIQAAAVADLGCGELLLSYFAAEPLPQPVPGKAWLRSLVGVAVGEAEAVAAAKALLSEAGRLVLEA